MAAAAGGVASRFYAALAGSEPVCVMQAIDIGEICGVFSVATLKGHRGRGLASALIGVALEEAHERGLGTSTLQASMLGKGVYERLGYGVDFRWVLWERRSGRLA
jgi:GNAT superfamily N-acetyltransferase